MSNSRAAPPSAGVQPPLAITVARLAVAGLAALTLLGWVARAQDAPTLALNAYEFEVGQVLELTGSHLTPGESYRITVTPAGGTPRAATLPADRSGVLRYRTTLLSAGDHAIEVQGPRLNALLTVSVTPRPGAAEPPPAQAAPVGEAAPVGPQAEPESGPPTPATPAPVAEPAPEPAPEPAAPATAAPAAPRTPAAVPYPTVELVGGSVRGVLDGEAVWTLSFPPGSGATAGLVEAGPQVAVGHGNHVLMIDRSTGVVQKRYRLPAQVEEIAGSAGALSVTVMYSSGAQGREHVLSTGPESSEPFDVEPDLYRWLRLEAQVPDAAARLAQDPTNPWLYLEAARASQPGSAEEARFLDGAAANAVTFYEGAQLAREFMRFSPPQREAAATLMYAALGDFVARGYRPELLYDPTLAEAYGFPVGAMQAALGRGDVRSAAFWADWVYLLATPAVPETQATLREYSSYLRASGDRDAAGQWLDRSREGAGFDLSAAIRQAALDVGRTGWYGVVALLVALLALYATLAAKYWRPQSLTLRRQGRRGGLARLFFLRYATFTERLVAVLLLAAAMALTALQGWAQDGDALPLAWGSGSLASVPALDALARVPGASEDLAFVRGYAEQTSGATDPAAVAYRAAPHDAGAANNLGVLLDDPALYQRALDLLPGLPAAAFNLGTAKNPSRLMASFAPDAKALVVPDETRLRSAVAGTFQAALAGVFVNPWQALTDVSGVGVAHWLWVATVVAFLLVVLLNLVQLVLPRPRLARNAPRTALYHVLAVLLPGTGQADELWGVLLSVPWAIFGVDLLLHYVPLGSGPALGLMTDLIALGVIYVVNLVAFFVELASYQRRMRALKVNHPDTARDYGMRA